jgi:GNAT superfamily N-acetyltransferase
MALICSVSMTAVFQGDFEAPIVSRDLWCPGVAAAWRTVENAGMNTSAPAAFSIRGAELRDVVPIVAMIRELAEFEHLTHLLQVTPEKLRPHLFGERPVVEALVAEVAGEVVGFALFFTTFSTFLAQPGLYLEDLYVRPDHRQLGVGSALIGRVGRLAVERECGRFEWSVLDWNTRAIDLYAKMGATVMPDWRICRVTGEALERFRA